MFQLTDFLTPKKLIEFYAKTGRPTLQQQGEECLVWFEIKIFYIKIVDALGFNDVPETLTLHYLPRSSSTVLEVDGKKIRPSASAFVKLRRSGIDGDKSVATYASTNSIRTTGKLCFEVYFRDETLICGALEKIDSVNNHAADQQIRQATWTVECSCALDYPSSLTKKVSNGFFPSLEVYVAGRVGSLPLVLTRAEQLIARRKRMRQDMTLDVIPEGNDYENSYNFDGLDNQEEKGEGSFRELDDMSISQMCGVATQKLSMLFEPKEMKCVPYFNVSWLDAGVRLGVGVALGVCLGLGIGVYLLLIRAYNTSARAPKKTLV